MVEPRLGLSQRRHRASTRGRTESSMSTSSGRSEEEESKPLLLSASSTKRATNHGYTIVPLQQRSTVARWDVLPFGLLYVALIAMDQTVTDSTDGVPGIELFKTIFFAFVLVSHLAIVILQQWKVSIQVWVGYKKMSRESEAAYRKRWTHCWVKAAASSSGHVDSAIVAIEHQQQTTSTDDSMVSVITFQDVVFRAPSKDPEMDSLWLVSNDKDRGQGHDEGEMFHTLRFPVDFPLDFYGTWKGWITLHEVKQAARVYGENVTSIQLPPFLDLLAEQLLAPFFLFQLFCVVLWSLDEYWYYAIFTLLALLMFECTVSNNRLRGLQRLRGTLRHAYHVRCFRHNQWTVALTNELLPGDVVSMRTSSADETHVPADMLVLGGGTAVVDEALLTGESTPQLKSPIDGATSGSLLDLQEHKTSILFGGTILVSQDSTATSSNGNAASIGPIPTPPDNGVVCMVLRTGFETAQGSLLRSMAHSSMKSADGIHTRDTFLFVGMLLLCAIASAAMVLQEGWHDETRNRFRLLLHVIIIVTSVVPPELPMELSLAVTNSVADLMKNCRVFCTEPYRIPWAGRVDTCCFDKTGTLTSDQMQLRGVRLLDCLGLNPDWEQMLHPSEHELPWEVLRVMVGCHALALTMKRKQQSNGARHSVAVVKDLIGNPLEKAVLKDTGYILQSSNSVIAKEEDTAHPKLLTIHHRFTFSSRLKRMTTLLTEGGSSEVWAVTKGAPETIKDFLVQKSIPENYDAVYKQQMMLGRRVLAMAYRKLDGASGKALLSGRSKKLRRESVEQGLTFCGFLVLDCPLKHDSKSVVTELKKSGHDVVMITGDAVLTAAEVARQVGITPKRGKQYELRKKEEGPTNADDVLAGFEFVAMHSEEPSSETSSNSCISLSSSSLQELAKLRSEASFCVSGATLLEIASAARNSPVKGDSSYAPVAADGTNDGETTNVLLHPAAQAVLKDLCLLISVFARHAPRQKEAVVAAFNLGGRHTLMCGDGTNDVGALKRAHVGISIISAPEVEAKYRDVADKVKKAKKKQSKKTTRAAGRKRKSNEEALKQSLRSALQDAQKELDQVELGDASVASPFTSRAMSIQCCKDVLQQGRCTLVTMLEIYKILGVNCLVNALVLTKLHMHGVKQGDRQLTILGMAVALLFFFVTRGKPISTLSPKRPPASVLCASALLSIAAQFGIHLGLILLATEISLAFVDPYDPSITPDAGFYPNVLNTCTFLLTMVATINTFAMNYRGKPFMQDLKDNKMLRRSLQLCYAVLFVCAMEIFPPLNELFQLSPFPDTTVVFGAGEENGTISMEDDWIVSIVDEDASPLTQLVGQVGFQITMSVLLLVDTIAVYGVERIILRIFD